MYSGAEIKSKFNNLWDVYSSGRFAAGKLNDFLEKAQVNYYYNLMRQYGLDSEVDEQLTPYLVDFVATPVDNMLDITDISTDMPEFKREIALKFKFIKNGQLYYEYGKPLKDDLKSSPLQGSILYPKYDFTSSNIRIYPLTESCLEASGLYFRNEFIIDVNDVVENIPLTLKNIQGILDEALNIAAQNTREDGYYKTSENELRQNTNS